MAPITNARLLFNSSIHTGKSLAYPFLYHFFSMRLPRHLGYPEPGKTTVYDTTEKIDLQTVALDGGILIKTLELSVDPYLRSQMREEDKSPAVSR